MANTFIELNDTPSDYTGSGLKFVRINAAADSLIFGPAELNDLDDVQANLAYTPTGGQALIYSSAAGKWRPGTMDVYSAGNGLNKSALTLNVQAGAGGGLTSNADGVYITDIDGIAGTYGNASYVPIVTVNSKGQVTDVTPTQIVAEYATTITNDFVGNIAGTSGQIRVTGGTGNNSNATIDLVATGVTAATYGNATHLPQITVDTYGRIQNVDLVEIAGGGDGTVSYANTLGFANIVVAGQTTISAERPQDSVIFAAGTATTITTQANADTIYFGVDTGAVASAINVADLADVDASGITNGQVLIWNSSTSKFEAGDMAGGSGSSNVDLTDFSVVTLSPSGNGSLTYDNAGVFTFTPANVQTGTTQSLSWNSSTYQLSISGGNTVDLSALSDDLTGLATETFVNTANTNMKAYVDTSIAGIAPSSSYGDSNVLTLLGNVSASIIPSANNTYTLGNATNKWAELYLSGNSIYINGSTISVSGSDLLFDGNSLATQSYVNSAVANVTVDLTGYATESYVDTANANMKVYVDAGLSNVTVDLTGYATETYVNNAITSILDGAPAALDTLNEIANALNGSNSTLSTVAFTGDYEDLTNRPTMSVIGNTYLVYDGSNVDLSSVVGQVGPQGEQGNAGVDGVSVTAATVTGSNLIITLSDSSALDAGNVVGPKGDQGDVGPQGDGNAGISTAVVNGSGNLIITLHDSTVLDAGNVKGAVGPKGDTGNAGVDGADGTDGVSITNVTLVGGNLVLDYSNTSTQDLGNIQGPKGDAGNDGLTVTNAAVNGSGNLIITLSDTSTLDAGNVKGADGTDGTDGVDGIQLSDISVTTVAASSGGSLSYNNVTGVLTFAPADLSSIPPSYGDANVQAYLDAQGYSNVDSDSQTLSLSGSNLSISGGNTVDLSGLGGGGSGTTYTGSTGITVDNAANTIALANTAVTAGTYGSSTKSPRITVDQQGRITSVTEATISGGVGGSGATIERFKLNYNSAGSLAGTANVSAGISSIVINSASGGECTITFDNGTYHLPPGSIMFYGYNYTNNTYVIVPMETSMGYREIPAGGSSGTPTLFDGTDTLQVKLRLREAETGASRGGFGTTTHAWIQFVMYD